MLRSQAEPLIEFVNSKERLKSLPVKKSKPKENIRGRLTGSEVRALYEGVICGSAENNQTGSAKTVTSQEYGDEHSSSQKSPRSKNSIKNDRRKHSSCSNLSYSNKARKETHSESSKSKKIDHDDSITSSKSSEKDQCQHSPVQYSQVQVRRSQVQLPQYCQNGDLDRVTECIAAGVDVGEQDQYGWSPLMCAACAGHLDIVQLLLRSGADWTSRDKSGKTAGDLAEQRGHRTITTAIDDHQSGAVSSSTSTSEDLDSQVFPKDEGFYCDICKTMFTEGSVRSHFTSTVHLFNRQLKPAGHDYLLAESNVGYRMMLKSGWVESQGLGPKGEGHKFPVKTVLKRDREGLGREKTSSPRVTHFRPGDAAAVKSAIPRGERRESLRSISRREMRRRERRDRDWEIRLRRYMNSE